jgi:hypothetical protein
MSEAYEPPAVVVTEEDRKKAEAKRIKDATTLVSPFKTVGCFEEYHATIRERNEALTLLHTIRQSAEE